ncbi:MAG: hypothetical protein JEY94_08675 [Melioribacteraceae bacterium]|nr:hypothetical protein [Melioribacteraceae bacterium]
MELNLITQNSNKEPRRIECHLNVTDQKIDFNIFELSENKLLDSISLPYKSMKSFIKQCEEIISLDESNFD